MSDSIVMEICPSSAPFFGFMGVTSALVFASKWALQSIAQCSMILNHIDDAFVRSCFACVCGHDYRRSAYEDTHVTLDMQGSGAIIIRRMVVNLAHPSRIERTGDEAHRSSSVFNASILTHPSLPPSPPSLNQMSEPPTVPPNPESASAQWESSTPP
jgi:hypothetical protein